MAIIATPRPPGCDEIAWSDRYRIGVEAIDLQHQYFVDLINHLSLRSKAGGRRDSTNRVLLELYKYADYHFCSEENIMLDHGYPAVEEHRELHRILLHDLSARICRLEAAQTDLDSLVGFLFLWFVGHTADEDQKLAAYLRNRPEHSPGSR